MLVGTNPWYPRIPWNLVSESGADSERQPLPTSTSAQEYNNLKDGETAGKDFIVQAGTAEVFRKNYLTNLGIKKVQYEFSNPQNTINLKGEEVVLKAKGRHDPCVVPRAVPIVEAMTNLVLIELLYSQIARKNIIPDLKLDKHTYFEI